MILLKMKRYSSITPHVSPKYTGEDKRISLNEENIALEEWNHKSQKQRKVVPAYIYSFKPTYFKVSTTYLNVVKTYLLFIGITTTISIQNKKLSYYYQK